MAAPPSYQACLQRVSDALHTPLAQLSAEWTSLAAEATKDAIADLTSILASKGYSQSQIFGADQFGYWAERLAFVITMQRGAALATYAMEGIKELDPRKMLNDLTILLIGGLPVAPDGTSQVGGIQSGVNTAVHNALHRHHGPNWGGGRW